MSLDFWSKMNKIDHTGMVKISRFVVKQFDDDSMVPNDTGRTTEDILSVETE